MLSLAMRLGIRRGDYMLSLLLLAICHSSPWHGRDGMGCYWPWSLGEIGGGAMELKTDDHGEYG